jgi:hypothetical protein
LAFQQLWPEAQIMNLLDDSLFLDRGVGALPPAMAERFVTLGRYAAASGADGILFTCSAFGPCIEACAADLAPIPVLKPNEAMIAEACSTGGRIGLMATFAGTLTTMPAEFPTGSDLKPVLIKGAFEALQRGDMKTHDDLVLTAAESLVDCDVFALAQFSLSRVAALLFERFGKPVYSTPTSAVRSLRRATLGPG